MNQLIAIALGGSVGALVRFFVANGIYGWLGRSFPYGTLFINVSGSFLMGFLTALLSQRFALVVEFRAALLIGFLGAYTTFSTYALETLYLFEDGSVLKAALNIFLSNVLSLTAVWIGILVGRRLFDNLAMQTADNLPYLQILSAAAGAFMLATVTQYALEMLAWSKSLHIVVYVVLLGVLTVCTTLWLVARFYDYQLSIQELLGIFISSNLGCVLLIWLGTLSGNWLWQLKQ